MSYGNRKNIVVGLRNLYSVLHYIVSYMNTSTYSPDFNQ